MGHRVLFVLDKKYQTEEDASEIMLHSFESCKQHVKDLKWVKENDLQTSDLSKTDFLVFEDFTGRDFDDLTSKKCAIVGPWCISICLLEGLSIPNFTWPIFNIAMRDCNITCSNLSKPQKLHIKERVQHMGGCYTENLTKCTTHIVSDSVISEKYALAAERNLPVMTTKWIEAVWERSLTENVHCTDAEFSRHRCPPFFNLIITCTGIKGNSDRQKYSDLIKQNGGQYSGALNLQKTQFLVVFGTNGTATDKYKAARQESRIKCVVPEWILDSVERGYALNHTEYTVRKDTSTPTKSGYLDPNFSTISAILPSKSNRSQVDETALQSILQTPTSSFNAAPKRKNQAEDEVSELVTSMNVRQAKLAGEFLDGCSVYLAGFNDEQRDKLCKILNFSGATRYDTVCERLTHIVVGDKTCPEMKLLQNKNINCPIVGVRWLNECLEAKEQIPEDSYVIEKLLDRSATDSPVCKKGLSLLRNRTVTEDDLTQTQIEPVEAMEVVENFAKSATNPFPMQEEDTFDRLMKNDVGGVESLETFTQELSEEDETIRRAQLFKSYKFQILDFTSQEDEEAVRTLIHESSGEIVAKSFKGMVNYCVLPAITASDVHRTGATEVINDLYIQECVNTCLLLEIEYYHRPLAIESSDKVLEGYVITVSGYTGLERDFLKKLVNRLGGVFQEQFARVPSVQKKVIASTHLVCPEPSGKKYEGALKWGLPALTRDWLLECARTGRGVDERPFLVGETNVSKMSETAMSVPSTSADSTLMKPPQKGTPVATLKQKGKNEVFTPSPVKPWNYVKTPETPLGSCFETNPSPDLRKHCQRWLNTFPDFVPPQGRNRRKSTPLSELKRKLWANMCGSQESLVDADMSAGGSVQELGDDSKRTEGGSEQDDMDLRNQLTEIENFVNSSANKRRSSRAFQSTVPDQAVHNKDSQFTVAWSYSHPDQKGSVKHFMMSGFEILQKEQITQQLESLGATVSSLNNFDPSATHLIAAKVFRNEKTIASMASGKWILHASYVEKCFEAKQFLDEEEFEFGNQKAHKNIGVNLDKSIAYKMECVNYWRKEVQKRGYGAFKDVRAIVISKNPEQIERVIEAGDGVVVKKTAPFDESVHATHCFIERRAVDDINVLIPLAKQGIFCVNSIYVMEFLHRTSNDIKEYICPELLTYYNL